MNNSIALKTSRTVAIVLLFIVALNALAAGYSFMAEPSGKDIGISTDYLHPAAPFDNFLVPGIILFFVNGVLSIVVAIITIKRLPSYPLFLMLQGCMLVSWILAQLAMVTTFHLLHLIIGLIGVIVLVAGFVNRR